MDYLKLEEAAGKLKVTEDDLLQRGESGELDIYVIPSPAWRFTITGATRLKFANGDDGTYVAEGELSGISLTMLRLKVSPLVLQAYRNYPADTTVDGFLHETENTTSVLQSAMEEKLHLKDCCLVVLAADIASKRVPPTRKAKTIEADGEVSFETLPVQKPESGAKSEVKIHPDTKRLRIKEVATLVGMAENTIRNHEKVGDFPERDRSKPGRGQFWKREDVDAYLAGAWVPPGKK